MIWVNGVCGMPRWIYLACFVYPGTSLAMVRSFAEHCAAPEEERRTAIVENACILGPLFLFKLCMRRITCATGWPGTRFSKFYRLNWATLIERNGGLVYQGYFDVARRYLLKPHDSPIHPGWDRDRRRERHVDRHPADVRFPVDRGHQRRAVGGDLPRASRRREFNRRRPSRVAARPHCAMAQPRPHLRPSLRVSLCNRT